MDKSLNDRIEELFRGVVFVLLSFSASLGLLLCNPLRGYALLIKRQRVRSTGQIRPYAFLFFSFVVLFFMPAISDALISSAVGPDVPEGGALARAYGAAIKRIETKAGTAILLTVVVGVTAFHLGAVGSGLGLIRFRARRETWRDALFFIGGLQFGLFALVVILDRVGWWSVAERRFISSLSLPPRDTFINWVESKMGAVTWGF
jgi:hypothetical protein